MTKEFITNYGIIEIRNVMVESENNTDLFEGIELKDENGEIIVVTEYKDINEMTIDEIETIIKNNQ